MRGRRGKLADTTEHVGNVYLKKPWIRRKVRSLIYACPLIARLELRLLRRETLSNEEIVPVGGFLYRNLQHDGNDAICRLVDVC